MKSTVLRIRALLSLGLVTAVFVALGMPSSHALTSVGLSVECDGDGHCASGTAYSTNAGINGLGAAETGAAAAACVGKGFPGATIVQISCSIGRQTRTMSFPGSAGAVPLLTTTSALDRLPVCWSVTAIFPVVTGPPHSVSTGDCALLSV